jgi:hypothetical protein
MPQPVEKARSVLAKGDKTVLLDGSDAFWWLVGGVKNSIGYLPAEDIETPAERVGRLNKHSRSRQSVRQPTDVRPLCKVH